MIDQEILKAWKVKCPPDMDVVFFGEVFGAKPGEAPQNLKSFQIIDDFLIIGFAGLETLHVCKPNSTYVSNEGSLIINEAEKLIWGWYSYGKPQQEQYWSTLTYVLNNTKDTIDTVANGFCVTNLKRFGDTTKSFRRDQFPAVQIGKAYDLKLR